jgi:hypothetical protein
MAEELGEVARGPPASSFARIPIQHPACTENRREVNDALMANKNRILNRN